ncbi:hypothetical protein NEDG_00086 [Nematocida displodere]|uniref:Uncharacterized protein n=1 Tax=Nematocida displodere TaxID=1805483 RepID=A0A177EJG4_9MICR|nr:hypothetical protein NEDG_00086 [Nematocida displodere]
MAHASETAQGKQSKKKQRKKAPPKPGSVSGIARVSKIVKAVKNFLLMPCRAFTAMLRRRREARAQRRQAREADESATEDEKKVSFSWEATIHMYPSKKKKRHALSLKRLSSSLPPKHAEAAMRLKGSSKETPLSRKILKTIEKKKSSLEALKDLLFSRKDESFEEPKRSKSKVMSILDGYSEASHSDALEHASPAEPPKKASTKAKEKRRRSSKAKKRDDLSEEETKSRREKKSRSSSSSNSLHSGASLSSVNSKISDILKRHMSNSPSPIS